MAGWLLLRDGRGERRRPGTRGPTRGARVIGALRLPALAVFGAFTASAALDGIAALLPPEPPPQPIGHECRSHAPATDGAPCETTPDTAPRYR
ncbi:hypothetical protein [Falsiroseomonas oryziterrae]|uniref:hypothetical protein n=1 Tax=Falsiroseomonas oryziterrae TaxID=2911368 RepID=UPI001F376197|nr:hypothetical protein [Roseomonas sp. NPKOSM-4]